MKVLFSWHFQFPYILQYHCRSQIRNCIFQPETEYFYMSVKLHETVYIVIFLRSLHAPKPSKPRKSQAENTNWCKHWISYYIWPGLALKPSYLNYCCQNINIVTFCLIQFLCNLPSCRLLERKRSWVFGRPCTGFWCFWWRDIPKRK